MTFSSVTILVTFLCVAAVFAAPSKLNSPFEESPYGISDNFQCAYDATVRLVNDAELKNELEDLKSAIVVIRNEFELCTSNADGRVIELLKCKVQATKSFLKAKNQFLRSVAEKKWELAIEIRKEIAKCFLESNSFEILQLSDSVDASSNLLEKFKCALEVTEKAVESVQNTELATIFYEYKPYIQEKLDEMVNCIRKQKKCADEKTIEVLHIFSEMHTNMENNADSDAYAQVVKFIKDNKC